MSRYQVIITRRAETDIDRIHVWWADHRDQDQATRWYTAIRPAIEQLHDNPERFPRSPECELFEIELRDQYFGIGSRKTHRIVFTIRDDSVLVLRVRHMAQSLLSDDDIDSLPATDR